MKGGALEAYIGALYEIMGFEVTRTVILNIMSEEIELYDPASNYIGRLQEWYQQHGLPLPVYNERTEKREGPAHSLRFTYSVCAGDGSIVGKGTGKNATEAKQEAAKRALEKIKKKP